MNLNKAMLIGRLTKDPETVSVGSTTKTGFSLAINEKWTKDGEQKEKVTFLDCEAWGRTGEIIAQYAKKGNPIYVEGKLEVQTWEDKNGGGRRSKTIVNVREFQFLGGKSDGGADAGDGAGDHGPARRGRIVEPGPNLRDVINHKKVTPPHTVTEEDIPF